MLLSLRIFSVHECEPLLFTNEGERTRLAPRIPYLPQCSQYCRRYDCVNLGYSSVPSTFRQATLVTSERHIPFSRDVIPPATTKHPSDPILLGSDLMGDKGLGHSHAQFRTCQTYSKSAFHPTSTGMSSSIRDKTRSSNLPSRLKVCESSSPVS